MPESTRVFWAKQPQRFRVGIFVDFADAALLVWSDNYFKHFED